MKKFTLIITASTMAMVFALSTKTLAHSETVTPSQESRVQGIAAGIGAQAESTSAVSFANPSAPTAEELQELVDQFNQTEGRAVVVIVDNACLQQVADHLSNVESLEEKTIVLVSSEYPLSVVDVNSDARTNLEAAIRTATDENSSGLYTCTESGVVSEFAVA